MKIISFGSRQAHPGAFHFCYWLRSLLHPRQLGWLWGLLLACSLPSVVHASAWTFQEGVGGFTGTVDTQLRAASPTNEYSSASTVLVDGSDGGAPVGGLLRFDHIFGNGVGQIPVEELGYYSAVLVLRTTAANANSSGTVRLHRLLQDWSEDCTWAGCFGGDGVQTNGIEAVATPDATFTPNFPDPGGSSANTRQLEIDVTTSIDAWKNGAPNYGWALIMDNPDGYQFDSAESTIITNRPQLQVYYGDPEPTFISQQPIASTNVIQCRSFSLSVTAIGLGPLIYQWEKDGFPISTSGNTQTLTIASAQLSDSGTYTVTVAGPGGAVQSSPSVVTVTEDDTAPTVWSVMEANRTNIVVTFSEPMKPMTSPEEIAALRLAYEIENDFGLSPAIYTNYFKNDTQLIITLAEPPNLDEWLMLVILGPDNGTPLFAACDQTAAKAVASVASPVRVEYHPLIGFNSTWKYHASGTDPGTAWKETDFNDSAWLTGVGIFDVNGSTPREEVAGLEVGTVLPLRNASTWTNANIPTYYFRKGLYADLSGWLWGTLSYVVDDAAIIYLNGEEVHRVGLPPGSVGSHTNYSQELGQPSPATPQVSGNVLLKLNWGWNVLAVALKNFNATSSNATFGMRLEGTSCDFCVEITAQPQDVRVEEGHYFSLRVGVSSPASYQWYKEGIPIPGATNWNYYISHAHSTDAGNYRVHVSGDWGGYEESQEATVTVLPDQTPPFLLGVAVPPSQPEHLLLSFAKTNLGAFWELDGTSVNNLTNYTLLPLVEIHSAAVTNGTNVLLRTAAREPLTLYTLTIRDLRDTAATPNLIVPNPTVRQFTQPQGNGASPPLWLQPALDGSLTLTWTNGGTLLEAPEVTGPWTESVNQANPQSLNISNKTRFFRLRY